MYYPWRVRSETGDAARSSQLQFISAFQQRELIREQVDEMTKQKLQGPWTSPVVLGKMSDGTRRFFASNWWCY